MRLIKKIHRDRFIERNTRFTIQRIQDLEAIVKFEAMHRCNGDNTLQSELTTEAVVRSNVDLDLCARLKCCENGLKRLKIFNTLTLIASISSLAFVFGLLWLSVLKKVGI